MKSLCEGTSSDARLSESQLDLIRECGRGWVDGKRTRALVLLGARNGVVALREAWGSQTPDPNGPGLTPDMLFHTASITKPVTATAVMMLVERGLIGITRPIVDYFPELKAARADEILVRHLLSHTSGFSDDICEQLAQAHEGSDYANLDAPEMQSSEHPVVWRGLHARNAVALAFEPGSQMEYCQYNYMLLGDLIRRVTGRGYKEFVESELLRPLGMNNSFIGIEQDQLDAVVIRGSGAPYDVLDHSAGLAPWGHCGLRSTADDLAIFAQMFLNKGSYGDVQIISPAAVEAMTRNQIPGIGTNFQGWHPEASWGWGWRVLETDRWSRFDGGLRSNGSFDHGGAGGCLVWADPRTQLVGVYLSVCLEINIEDGMHFWSADLYQDMLTAACT